MGKVENIEKVFLNFLYTVYMNNSYVTRYHSRVLKQRTWFYRVFGFAPTLLLAIISIMQSKVEFLLIIATIVSAIEGMGRLIPFDKRAEELLKYIVRTDNIILKLEHAWICYKNQDKNADWLFAQYRIMYEKYVQIKNEDATQETYSFSMKLKTFAITEAQEKYICFIGEPMEEWK